MQTTRHEEFQGFDFITPAKNIIAGNTEDLIIYSNNSGSTDDFLEVDNYFNDEMIENDRKLRFLLNTL